MAVSWMVLAEGVARAQCVAVNAVVPPAITLDITPGAPEFYFRENGRQSLLLGRNPTGWDTDGSPGVNTQHFDELFGYAAASERIMRIHVIVGARPNPVLAGDVDCNWLSYWDEVLTRAEQNGLHVLPVFGIHGQWKDTPDVDNWDSNEYNALNGKTCLDGTSDCLAATPGDLLDVTTPGGTGRTWIAWVRTMVAHWKNRSNIVGWEIFSEVDLITGSSESAAAAFIEAAKAEIRAEDVHRPVTASLSGTIDWPLVNNSSIDFIQLHPYSSTFGPGNLNEMILTFVRDRRLDYPDKPLFIGESGLHYLSPDNVGNPYTLAEPGARTGINQAIWAGAVSGAMNARTLWWEDGYDRFHIADLCGVDGLGASLYPQYASYAECADGDASTVLTLRALYADAAAPVAAFVQGVDYANFDPIDVTFGTGNVTGAALGGSDLVLGWVKDGQSTAVNDWVGAGTLIGETATVDVTGTASEWLVDFYNTATGTLTESAYAPLSLNGDVTLTLGPANGFDGSIGFKLRAVLPVTIDVIPGTQNRINMTAPTPIYVPAAILGAIDFDPTTTVDAASVRFGPGAAEPVMWDFFDVNGDGVLDLRLRFLKADTGFTCRAVQDGVLTGITLTGQPIKGTDPVRIRGAGLPPC